MGGPPMGGAPMAAPMSALAAPAAGGALMASGGGGGGDDIKKSAMTWLILSCLSFCFGCSIFALVPIFFAFKAKQAADAGDAAEFQAKVKIAKICVIIGWVLVVLAIIYQIVAIALLS